jgi:hypothetical protein
VKASVIFEQPLDKKENLNLSKLLTVSVIMSWCLLQPQLTDEVAIATSAQHTAQMLQTITRLRPGWVGACLSRDLRSLIGWHTAVLVPPTPELLEGQKLIKIRMEIKAPDDRTSCPDRLRGLLNLSEYSVYTYPSETWWGFTFRFHATVDDFQAMTTCIAKHLPADSLEGLVGGFGFEIRGAAPGYDELGAAEGCWLHNERPTELYQSSFQNSTPVVYVFYSGA